MNHKRTFFRIKSDTLAGGEGESSITPKGIDANVKQPENSAGETNQNIIKVVRTTTTNADGTVTVVETREEVNTQIGASQSVTDWIEGKAKVALAEANIEGTQAVLIGSFMLLLAWLAWRRTWHIAAASLATGGVLSFVWLSPLPSLIGFVAAISLLVGVRSYKP